MEKVKKLMKYLKKNNLKLEFWKIYHINSMEYGWNIFGNSNKNEKIIFDSLYDFTCKDFDYLYDHKNELKDVLTYLGDDFDTFVLDY